MCPAPAGSTVARKIKENGPEVVEAKKLVSSRWVLRSNGQSQ
jgi:hypothetical protein